MATVEIPTHHLLKTFVGAPRKMLIGGKWLEAASGKTFPTDNPATGEILRSRRRPDPSNVRRRRDGVIHCKRVLVNTFPLTPPHEHPLYPWSVRCEP